MEHLAQIPFEFVTRSATTVPPSELQEYASHRLHFALRPFQDQVRRVILRLEDENGPRRGIDTRCVISVELDRGAPIVVEATTAWPTASMTAAARRVNEVIRRRRDREHGLTRRRGHRGG